MALVYNAVMMSTSNRGSQLVPVQVGTTTEVRRSSGACDVCFSRPQSLTYRHKENAAFGHATTEEFSALTSHSLARHCALQSYRMANSVRGGQLVFQMQVCCAHCPEKLSMQCTKLACADSNQDSGILRRASGNTNYYSDYFIVICEPQLSIRDARGSHLPAEFIGATTVHVHVQGPIVKEGALQDRVLSSLGLADSMHIPRMSDSSAHAIDIGYTAGADIFQATVVGFDEMWRVNFAHCAGVYATPLRQVKRDTMFLNAAPGCATGEYNLPRLYGFAADGECVSACWQCSGEEYAKRECPSRRKSPPAEVIRVLQELTKAQLACPLPAARVASTSY